MSKKRIRFNFLDVLIVLAVLALVVGIIWREELTERIEDRNIENTITVCCELNAFANDGTEVRGIKFEEGKTVVYLDGEEVGYIEHTRVVESAPEESGDESGDEDEIERPAQITEETKLYLKAVSRESGYYVSGQTKLLIGGDYEMNTKDTRFTVHLLSISEVK